MPSSKLVFGIEKLNQVRMASYHVVSAVLPRDGHEIFLTFLLFGFISYFRNTPKPGFGLPVPQYKPILSSYQTHMLDLLVT